GRQVPAGSGAVESSAPSSMTTGVLTLLGGAALGTLAMYMLDPKHGDERRAAARQMAQRALQTSADGARSAYNRTSQVAGNAWDKVPSGQRFVDSASNAASSAADTAHGWFDSARSYLSRRSPQIERHSDYAMEPVGVCATAFSMLLIGA